MGLVTKDFVTFDQAAPQTKILVTSSVNRLTANSTVNRLTAVNRLTDHF